MPHPVIHAEIRSDDPDATRQFYPDLFGWRRTAEALGGTIVQPAQHVPGTSFGVFVDAQRHEVGVAAAGQTS